MYTHTQTLEVEALVKFSSSYNVYIQPLSLEEGKATHSIMLAWRIPWIEELGGLQYMGSQIVGYD